MTRLDSSEIDGSVSYIDPYSHFEGLDTAAARMVAPEGAQPHNATQSTLTGGLFGVWSYSPDLKFGLAATTPYGNTVSYNSGWIGRYQSLVDSVMDAEVLISAAYRINDQFSIGGGPVFDYFHAKIGQAINIGPASAMTGDPQVAVEAGDFAVGYDIGSLWQPTDALRFGANYRSRISHDLSGPENVSVPQS
jgi:long-chain fatty acid transport protein